jgi:endonuclease III
MSRAERNLHEFAQNVYERLVDEYGERERKHTTDPLDMLVGTILSANTNDVNSGRAFRELQERYGGNWDAVRHAPLDDIKDAIRVAGMYNQKAPNIVKTLELIEEDRGEYSLDFLSGMEVDEAMEYLLNLPGVGHKTASILLLFRFGMAAFPVDTHVQRVSQRLGITSSSASAEKVKRAWEDLMPAENYYTLHVDLIRHGRTVCTARKPKCDECLLQDICDFAQEQGDWTADA